MATCSRFLNDQSAVVARGDRQAIRRKSGIDMEDAMRTAIGGCLRIDIYFVWSMGNLFARCGIPNLRFRRSCFVIPMVQRHNLFTILGKLQSANLSAGMGWSFRRFDNKLPTSSRTPGHNSNHVANGLLLRTDIHTIFDLDLIGIAPDSLTISLSPAISSTVLCQPAWEETPPACECRRSTQS